MNEWMIIIGSCILILLIAYIIKKKFFNKRKGILDEYYPQIDTLESQLDQVNQIIKKIEPPLSKVSKISEKILYYRHY